MPLAAVQSAVRVRASVSISTTVASVTRRRMSEMNSLGLRYGSMSAASDRDTRLAVLHQAIEPPVIGGVKKAMKPGGYKDSSADIAYVIRQYAQQNPTSRTSIEVVSPTTNLEPTKDEGWSFPDTEASLLSAVNDHGATHFWANTILFSKHPLQISEKFDDIADRIYMVGQPPQLVEKYDDKNWVNSMLRKDPSMKLPKSWTIDLNDVASEGDLQDYLRERDVSYPVVGKPIRGRGSHGVKLCRGLEELVAHLNVILTESPQIMVEEFLAGQEGTVTVMPPSGERPRYWALPVVERFNHNDGVAPYNGVVAVIANSRVVPVDVQAYQLGAEDSKHCERTQDADNAYVDIRRQCERVAQRLGCTAPIRIDVRRKREGTDTTSQNPFMMFDVNMKPNMTGPGRPGRENQASLTAMAAEALGWDYARLLQEILKSAQPLSKIRRVTVPFD